jgi:magnesium-transporting ATPase (P-type)
MDSLAAIALATEKPTVELLKRPPYRKREYIIS